MELHQVISALDRLSVQHQDQPKRNGWLPVICPLHHDTNYGNADLHVETSVFHCFACGATTNLVGLVMELRKISIDEAKEWIGIDDSDFDRSLDQRQKKRKAVRRTPEATHRVTYKLNLEEFDPANYEYTALRGFTKEFNQYFNVTRCKDNWFKDYVIIPITDSNRGISSFEARRLAEAETIRKIIRVPPGISAKEAFAQYCDREQIEFHREKEWYLTKQGHRFKDETLFYLLKPKVLYPSFAQLDDTIFNIDNLNFNEDLYICEGIAGIPKVWSTLSRNVTCLFGAAITPQQEHILSLFKGRKIIIPDRDEASMKMIWKLCRTQERIWVLPLILEDTDPMYSAELLDTEPIEGTRYLIRQRGVLYEGEEP